jgi:hypothetical protein
MTEPTWKHTSSKARVRAIIDTEQPYMPDEPSVIGSPDSLYGGNTREQESLDSQASPPGQVP